MTPSGRVRPAGGEETELAAARACLRFNDLAQLGFAGGNGGQIVEGLVGDLGDHAGEGGFTNSRRPPEYHAGHSPLLQGAVERFAGADQMRLTDEAAEVAAGGCRSARGWEDSAICWLSGSDKKCVSLL